MIVRTLSPCRRACFVDGSHEESTCHHCHHNLATAATPSPAAAGVRHEAFVSAARRFDMHRRLPKRESIRPFDNPTGQMLLAPACSLKPCVRIMQNNLPRPGKGTVMSVY